MAAAHRAVLRTAEGAARHGWNTDTHLRERERVRLGGQGEEENVHSEPGPGAALPLHVGASWSQVPDEVHWRRWDPRSSNPSSQRNAQVVFHGELPGLGEHSTCPLAGRVKASHSTTGDSEEHRELHGRRHSLSHWSLYQSEEAALEGGIPEAPQYSWDMPPAIMPVCFVHLSDFYMDYAEGPLTWLIKSLIRSLIYFI